MKWKGKTQEKILNTAPLISSLRHQTRGTPDKADDHHTALVMRRSQRVNPCRMSSISSVTTLLVAKLLTYFDVFISLAWHVRKKFKFWNLKWIPEFCQWHMLLTNYFLAKHVFLHFFPFFISILYYKSCVLLILRYFFHTLAFQPKVDSCLANDRPEGPHWRMIISSCMIQKK